MNILYINHYAGSLDMGMEFRPFYLAREWQKMGHKVRIVAATFSHLRKRNPSVERDFETQIIDGIEYQWIKTGEYEGNGVARAKTMFEFCGKLNLNARKIAKEFMPDLVIASSTYPLDTYPAQRIAKIAGCRYIHEAHDLWPLTLTEIGGMSRTNPFVIMLAIAERSAYSNADKVVSLFPFAYKHMLKHGMQSVDKFVYIPNGIVIDDWKSPESMPDEHEKALDMLKREGKFIVMYLGGHALSNALDVLLDAAARTTANKDIAYVLVGKGVEKERLISNAHERGLDNVVFLPPVEKTQVPAVLQKADALYVGAASSPIYKFGVSLNKMYDYMMAGVPILNGVDAPNNDVAESECGITIRSDDSQALVDAIEEIRSLTPDERKQMGTKGRTYVAQNYDYKILAETFMKI